MKARPILPFAAALLFPLAASAEDAFAPQTFFPALGPGNFVTVESSRVEGRLAWSAGALGSYERNPFEIDRVECNRPLVGGQCPGNDYRVIGESPIVDNQLVLHLMGSVTLLKRLQLGLDLPLAYVTANELDPATGVRVQEVRGFGLSDPRLFAKYRIWGRARGLGIAAGLGVTFPMADLVGVAENRHLGAGTPTFLPRVIVDYRLKKLEVGANLFVDVRYAPAHTFSSTLGTAIGWSIAGGYEVSRRVRPIVELFGSSTPPFEEDVSPVELDGAVQLKFGQITATGGLGIGITGGVGSPDFRGFLGALYSPTRGDRDHDGIDDAVDHCKDDEEDEDEFQDSDGCPEADNDADGMADAADRCPNEPEDVDEFQDTDGCPDADNDGDGVADGYDSCKNVAEDKDGDQDDDGCPDEDEDGDGVPDINDRCQGEAEDTDGHDDEDGCPDLDDDNDGVPDASDQCGEEAEDRDGVQDDDGCPEEGRAPRRRHH